MVGDLRIEVNVGAEVVSVKRRASSLYYLSMMLVFLSFLSAHIDQSWDPCIAAVAV